MSWIAPDGNAIRAGSRRTPAVSWNCWRRSMCTRRSSCWDGLLNASPGLVRDIAAGGHELGCHSYWHRLIYKLEPAEFREDTRRAKDVIEQISGQPINVYRAPTYSVIDRSFWALEILAELGFSYDSSIYPIHHDRYGMPGAPRAPFRFQTPSGPMTEFPLTTFRLAGHNMPVGGGAIFACSQECTRAWD